MARATWYVLEDGRIVDPGECLIDENGHLTHSSGVKVAMRFADCPMSRGVDVDEGADAGQHHQPKEMNPAAPKRRYRTRESKAG